MEATLGNVFRQAVLQIQHLCVNPHMESRWIIESAWDKTNQGKQCPNFIEWNHVTASNHIQKTIYLLVTRRSRGEPLGYVLGEVEFYGHKFNVNDTVLIPRMETENMVDIALDLFPHKDNVLIWEVGVGAGVIACSLQIARPQWEILGSDISTSALTIANSNFKRYFPERKPIFSCQDLIAPEMFEKQDLIISNPPYLPHKDINFIPRQVLEYEPHLALFGGDKGWELSFELMKSAYKALKPGGYLLLEINPPDSTIQIESSSTIGYTFVKTVLDFNHLHRHLLLQKK